MLDFKPTTTVAELSLNNTAAAGSFLGLSNNVAPPKNVSTVSFNVPQQIFEHDVKWWKVGQKNHIAGIGYSSDDPMQIARQLVAYGLRGYTGGNWLWNGAGGQQDLACLAAKPLFEAAGKQFQIMLSSTIPSISISGQTVAQRTAAMNKILDYLRTTFFKSPSYNRYQTRPVLFMFGFANGDYDWTAVKAHAHTFGADEPLFVFRMEEGWGAHLGADMYFSWTHFSESWITFAKKFAKPLVGSVNAGFNNSLAGWGTPQIIPQNGGQRLQDQLAIFRAHPELAMLLIVTGNDYEEGTATEPGIASGQSLTLGLSANTLSWNDVGTVFDHYDIYLSQNGTDLMKIATTNSTGLNLGLFDLALGDYKFFVQAIGKPLVQNILSAPAPLTLGWR